MHDVAVRVEHHVSVVSVLDAQEIRHHRVPGGNKPAAAAGAPVGLWSLRTIIAGVGSATRAVDGGESAILDLILVSVDKTGGQEGCRLVVHCLRWVRHQPTSRYTTIVWRGFQHTRDSSAEGLAKTSRSRNTSEQRQKDFHTTVCRYKTPENLQFGTKNGNTLLERSDP